MRHQVHRYLDIISYLGGNRDCVQPKIWIEPTALPALGKFAREGGQPFFGLNAGAEYGPAKRWMPQRFAEVAAKVSDKVPCRWLLFGGPNANDMQIADMIETQLRANFVTR